MKIIMKFILLIALVGVSNAAFSCSDSGGDSGDVDFTCTGATFYASAAGTLANEDTDCADQTGGCTNDECCGACRTDAATCTSAVVDLTCNAGFWLNGSAGGGATCTACTAATAANATCNTTTCDAAADTNPVCATATCNAGFWSADATGGCAACTAATAANATCDTTTCDAGADTNPVCATATCNAGFWSADATGGCTACTAATAANATCDTTTCDAGADTNPVCATATCNDGFWSADATQGDCAACNDTNGNIATCNGADVDDALTCTAGNGFAAGACTECTGSTFSLGALDCAAYATPTCTADTQYLVAGSASNDASCAECTATTGFATCTDATTAVTCAAGYEFDSGACTECAPGMFVATAGVAACADWTAPCPDGTVPLPDGTTTADRAGAGTCTACATTGAATCNASDVALTCAVGFFDALPACTACTAADDADNVVPTAWVVPANATGDAGTWNCAAADVSGWETYTCDTGFTANTAGDACEADVAVTTTAAPSSTSADGSDTSPAFIVGTAIAGIALLL